MISNEELKALNLLVVHNKSTPPEYKVFASNTGACATILNYDDLNKCEIICLVCLTSFIIDPSDQSEWQKHLLSHLNKIKAFI